MTSSFLYSVWFTQMEDTMQPLRPYEKRDTLRQFLDHDRHVLRFFCVWDDREINQFGDVRQVSLFGWSHTVVLAPNNVFPCS